MAFGKVWELFLIEEVLMVPNTDGNGFLLRNCNTLLDCRSVIVKKFMFAYTYSHVTGPIKFDTGGYHQITLGVDCSASR
jgi:hypothetical protein